MLAVSRLYCQSGSGRTHPSELQAWFDGLFYLSGGLSLGYWLNYLLNYCLNF